MQRREMFARFGAAMYHAQCVEKQLAILAATTFNPEFLKASTKERSQFLDRELARNLGELLRLLRQKVDIAATTDDRLATALHQRNWLAHNYFVDRADDIRTWDGRERMIEELQQAADDFSALDDQLTDVTKEWLARCGCDEEMLQTEVMRHLAK